MTKQSIWWVLVGGVFTTALVLVLTKPQSAQGKTLAYKEDSFAPTVHLEVLSKHAEPPTTSAPPRWGQPASDELWLDTKARDLEALSLPVPLPTALMGLLCIMLLALWVCFQREVRTVQRIRIAAGIGFVSLTFLAMTQAVPWIQGDPSLDQSTFAAACDLSNGQLCALSPATEFSVDMRFQLFRWVGASTALRIGIFLSVVLLIVPLSWLLANPRCRLAQAGMALGASAASYTILSALFYWITIPSWMTVRMTPIFDMALLALTNIVIAASAVTYLSLRESPRIALPQARAIASNES